MAWLSEVGLKSYESAFLAEGYDDVNTIASLSDDELVDLASDLQMPRGHSKKLQLSAAALRKSLQGAEHDARGPTPSAQHSAPQPEAGADTPLQRAKRAHGSAWSRLSSAEKSAILTAMIESPEEGAARKMEEAARKMEAQLLEKEAEIVQEQAKLRKAKLRHEALRESVAASIAELDGLIKGLEV